jgi:hypothetical protein
MKWRGAAPARQIFIKLGRWALICLSYEPRTSHLFQSPSDNAPSASFKLKFEINPKNTFEAAKPHLMKLVMINHHLVVCIHQDPGELRGLYVVELRV